jgi:hypothetical protein
MNLKDWTAWTGIHPAQGRVGISIVCPQATWCAQKGFRVLASILEYS